MNKKASSAARYYSLKLIEGTPDGPMEVLLESKVASHKIFVIPRKNLQTYRSDREMNGPGVYVLLGKLDERPLHAYIGQADIRKNGNGTISRVLEHLNAKRHTFCQWAILLVGDEDSLNATELNYLENTLTTRARKAALVSLENGNDPHISRLKEKQAILLSDILDDLDTVLKILRIPVFSPPIRGLDSPDQQHQGEQGERPIVPTTSQKQTTLEPTNSASLLPTTFYLKVPRSSETSCLEFHGPKQYVLKAGSSIRETATHKLALRMRQNDDGKVVNGRTTVDLVFTSASSAANYVTGTSTNGRLAWKTENGMTLQKFLDQDTNN